MSSSTSSSLMLPSCQKLKGEENYSQWVRAIETIADQFDLHKYYHADAPEGPERVNEFTIKSNDSEGQTKLKAWKEWIAQEAKMRQAIEFNIFPGPMAVIATEKTAKSMWAKLKLHYEGSGTMLEYATVQDYVRQNISDFPNLETFVNNFQKSCERLITLNLTDVRKWHPTMFVMKVKDQFPVWAERQRSNIRINSNITVESLIADLTDEARETSNKSGEIAMISKGIDDKKGSGKQRSGTSNKSRPQHCKVCGNPQARHSSEKCFEDPRNREAKVAWEKKHGKSWINYKSKKTKEQNKKKGIHHQNSGMSDDDEPSTFVGAAVTSYSSSNNSWVLPATFNSVLMSSTDMCRWIVDTGADHHICKDLELFDTYSPSTSLPSIGTANGPTRPLGIGTVTLWCELRSGKIRKLPLTNVLFMPQCPVNLFSGRKLYSQGGYVGNQGCMFDSNHMEIATVDEKMLICEKPRTYALPAPLHNTKPSIILWHRRLGHLGLKNVKLTEKIADGIKYSCEKPSESDSVEKTIICESCELSRPLRHVRKTITPRNLAPFDQISVDVLMIKPVGRMLVDESWVQIKYAIIFTDSATSFRWAIFQKEKKGAYEAVQQFNILSRTQYNSVVKCWRVDGGKEYSPKQMGSMARSLGQIVELTTPYNPEQDGRSERSIGIISTRTRTVIIDKKIPQFLWPEIMRAQVYIINRVATSVLKDETPYQALNRLTLGDNKKPNLAHLRVLGCKTYVQIPVEKRILSHKLDARAEIGILVGYEGSHIFRIYMPSHHKVVRSSNVTFDEDGLVTSPEDEPHDEIQPEFLELRNKEEALPSDSRKSDDENANDEQQLSPFETLASGQERLNDEYLVNSSSRSRRPRITYKPASRTTRSGNSILPPPPPPDESAAFIAFLAATACTSDPLTIDEALNGPDENEWRQAFRKEYNSLWKNKTWEILDRCEVPYGKKILSGKIVMKTKRDKEGVILKRKVRWVVKGFEQIYGKDYTQTYAGVCRNVSWKILIAIAAIFDLEIDQMDAVTAFLNSKTDDDIFVELPPMYTEPGIHKLFDPVCKLKKSLYGLKQAPRLWQSHLRIKLSEIGFKPLESDNCIYFEMRSKTFLVTYVDDFLIIGKNREKIDKIKAELRSKFDLEDLGAANYFLGVRIVRNRPAKKIYLCQDAYIKQILERFSLENCVTTDCPSAAGSEVHMLKFEGTASKEKISEYQSKIGSLLYLAIHTRPDIAFQCSTLSRFLTNPSPQHMKAANRIFQYLAGTKNLCIVYDGNLEAQQCKLHCFCDSDWAGCRETRLSTGGNVFFLAGGVISASSKRQTSVSLSSTEAEYYALGACIRELIWIQQLMREMQYKGKDIERTRLYSDSQSALALSENPELHQRTKHIDIKHHFIRNIIDKGSVNTRYISTKEMVADGLTKNLPSVRHKRFVQMLRMKQLQL